MVKIKRLIPAQYNGTYVPINDISKVGVKQSNAVMTERPPQLILYSLDKSHRNAKPRDFMVNSLVILRVKCVTQRHAVTEDEVFTCLFKMALYSTLVLK